MSHCAIVTALNTVKEKARKRAEILYGTTVYPQNAEALSSAAHNSHMPESD
jgi:hypothetical protein